MIKLFAQSGFVSVADQDLVIGWSDRIKVAKMHL